MLSWWKILFIAICPCITVKVTFGIRDFIGQKYGCAENDKFNITIYTNYILIFRLSEL